MPRASYVVLLLALATAASGLQAVAQDKRKLAITNLAEVDADFAFQGEFWGDLNRPLDGVRLYGLQVIAHGEGKFAAVVLRGGLPGAGWDRAQKSALEGSIEDGRLTLVGDRFQAEVTADSAVLQDSGGQTLGTLDRVRRVSPTLGATPPAGAIVLFGGQPPEHLEGGKVTPDGLLQTGTTTAMPVRDFRLHIEFRTPYMPHARSQGRGNSGVYIQQRYEVQILDSFGLDGVKNECGGLYKQRAPDVNMCLPPLTWQTYDIHFTAARWDADGKTKVRNARITVVHNGVAIHDDVEVKAKTGAGRKEEPEPRPIHFQHHGNPVHFRNMWIVLQRDDPPTPSPSDLPQAPGKAAPPTAGSPSAVVLGTTCPAPVRVVCCCPCPTKKGRRSRKSRKRCR